MHSTTKLDDYPALLRGFRDAGYAAVGFTDLGAATGQLLLRHDVDFDVAAALRMAEWEYAAGMSATYFFLVSSDSYNPYSHDNLARIRRIQALGHTVSIHFDPPLYSDPDAGLAAEKSVFERLLDTTVNVVSIHRPSPEYLQHDATIAGCPHTYMKRYCSDIAYLSDSTGTFRFGHPFDSAAFADGRSLQLLIHPIWWTYAGATPQDKLRAFYHQRTHDLREHYALNCKPFLEIRHDLA